MVTGVKVALAKEGSALSLKLLRASVDAVH